MSHYEEEMRDNKAILDSIGLQTMKETKRRASIKRMRGTSLDYLQTFEDIELQRSENDDAYITCRLKPGDSKDSARTCLLIMVALLVALSIGTMMMVLFVPSSSDNNNKNMHPIELTSSSFSCFEDLTQLREAVDLYVHDSSPESQVAEQYGHPIGTWCVDKVTSLQSLFSANRLAAMVDFNQDVSGWDTSRVTNMKRLFEGASSFNQDLSHWNVSQVDQMEGMFAGATSFAQNLCSWGHVMVHKHVTVHDMFQGTQCEALDDPFLSHTHIAAGPFCHSCNSAENV